LSQTRLFYRSLLVLSCLSLLLLMLLPSAYAAGSAISGVVKDTNSVPFVGISVALYAGTSPTPTATTTTNADGRFYFTELAEGVWTVKPTRDGTTFDPHYRTYTLPPTVSVANFTGTPPLVTGSAIGGVIKNSAGVAAPGVSVGLYQGDSLKTSTTTNAQGSYYLTGLAAGAYSVKPGQTGKVFDPVSRAYTVPPSVTNANFTIGDPPSVISGLVKTAAGVAVADVSVGLYQGDSLKTSTTTNAEGRYSFPNVLAGSYLVKPGQVGKVFDPVSRTIAAPPGTTAANFTIAEAPSNNALSGVIKTAAGVAVANVPVNLYLGTSATPTANTTTNAEGRYYFTGLAAGTWTAKPAQSGKVFDPLYRTYALPPTVTNADFKIAEALYAISGVIKTAGGAAVANVSVGLYQGDSLKTSTTTNADGRYYFTALPAGAYTVKPGQTGKVFDPVQRALALPPTISIADFRIGDSPDASVITGLIKNAAGAGLMGVAVGLYSGDTPKGSTTTNFEGRYYFTGLAAGTYQVKPAVEGMVFDPASRSVTVPPSVTDANFVGAPKPLLPTLREGGVTPTAGSTTTLFVFSVIYTDAANREPAAASRLIVDGSKAYRMVKQEATDTNFVDGCKYIYKLLLPAGSHTFRFVFAPTGGPEVFLPGPTASTSFKGPTVTGDTYVISGIIAVDTSRLQGVTVTVTADGIDPVIVTTNTEGRYYATGLYPGQYTVTPTKEGYTFDAPYKTVTLPPSTTTCGFKAVAQ